MIRRIVFPRPIDQPTLPFPHDPDEIRRRIEAPDWLRRCWECRRFYNYRCALNVDHRGALHVHHRTYVRLWREWPTDLICLCEGCHRRFHGRLPRWSEPEVA